MKINAKLTKVFDNHLPIDESSSRSIQRVAALFLGHGGGKITPEDLRALCEELGLFDFEGRVAGKNTFAANFTQNMKKDGHYFSGDHENGWKLTAEGKAEAKAIFEDGAEPTKRRVSNGAKKATKKTAKKASTKKKAAAKKGSKKSTAKKKAAAKKGKATKKAAAPKAKAKAKAKAKSGSTRAKRKAALKRKKQGQAATEAAAPAEATAGATN